MRFPYIHALHDEDDYLYTTSDIAIWSIGITTLINHGSDAGLANDMDSDASGSITQDGWNGSQAHLAGEMPQEHQQQPIALNIKVKKTIVQATGSGNDPA